MGPEELWKANAFKRLNEEQLEKLFCAQRDCKLERYKNYIIFLKDNKTEFKEKLGVDIPEDLYKEPNFELRVCKNFEGIFTDLLKKFDLGHYHQEEYEKKFEKDFKYIEKHGKLLEKIESSKDEKNFGNNVKEFINYFEKNDFFSMAEENRVGPSKTPLVTHTEKIVKTYEKKGEKVDSMGQLYGIFLDNELEKLFDREKSCGPERYKAFINFLGGSRAELKDKLGIDLPENLCKGPAVELKVCGDFKQIVEGLLDKSTLSDEAKRGYKEKLEEDLVNIEKHRVLLEKIENSRDEKEFRDNVGKFIDYFKESYFLPMDNKNDNRWKYALWTNFGLGGFYASMLYDENGGYREYQDDERSCLIHHTWGLVTRRCLPDEHETPLEVKEGRFMSQLREECKSKAHIPYDKILSEIYVEKIDPKKLIDLRVEYAQNLGLKDCSLGMHSGRVFYANELPVLLEKGARYNLELDKKYRKDKKELEKESKQLEQAEKELQSERFSFVKALNKGETGNGKNAEVPIVPGYGDYRAFIESSSVFPLTIDFQKMLEDTETLISHTRVLDELEEKAQLKKEALLKKEKGIEKKFLSIADLDEVSENSRSVKNYDFYDGESIFTEEGEDRRSKLIGNNNDEEKPEEKSREELRVMAQVIREGKKSEEYKTIPGLDKKMIGSVVSAFAVGKALRDKDPNWRQNKGILNLDEVPSEYNLSLAQIKPKDNGPEISIADIDSQKSLPDNNKNVGKSMDGVKA